MKIETQLLILALVISNMAAQCQDYTFVTNNGTITITKFNGPGGEVTVPSEITSLQVTAVGDSAFGGRIDVTKVVIPDGVTSIGNSVFAGCKGLRSVTIPDGVQTLGERTFYRCANLSSINLPESLISIGSGAFLDCVSLTSIAIPQGVTTIGSTAFQRCVNLSDIRLPSTLTTIGDAAFSQCSGLRSIVIPPATVNLGDGVFNYCDNLAAAYFQGNALEQKPDMPFFYSPTTVYYLPGTSGWESSFRGRPTERWLLPSPIILSRASGFGMQAEQFGFRISWATNALIVIEAAQGADSTAWAPVQTNALADGWTDFSDPDSKSHSARFYRVRPF